MSKAKKFNDYTYIVDVDGVRLDECIGMRDFRVKNNHFTGEDSGTSELQNCRRHYHCLRFMSSKRHGQLFA